MKSNKLTLGDSFFPEAVKHIPSPPQQLYYQGPLTELLARPCLAVVGSRKLSPYGRRVTAELVGAAARRGIVIVSGLAFGVDAVAHQAALEAGGGTIAVLPSSLDRVYPASHRGLAERILQNGGALVSEYDQTPSVRREYFIARNRLISGLSRATLITEAALKSGSLHTARFTLEQGRDVFAVPGSIYSETSVGTNNLIKAGAVAVTSVEDILFALRLSDTVGTVTVKGADAQEQVILDLIAGGTTDGEVLFAKSGLDIAHFNDALTMLELTGTIRSLGGNNWTLS